MELRCKNTFIDFDLNVVVVFFFLFFVVVASEAMKVVMRRKGNILFSIHGGEVYKAPGSDTYIVFGEAQPEDLISSAQREAVKKFKTPQEAVKPTTVVEDDQEDEKDDEDIDTEGVEEKDIELVMAQAGVSKVKAVKALKKNSNDIVNAIMELTM